MKSSNLLNFDRYGSLYSGILFLLFAIIYGVQFPNIRVTAIGVIDSRAYPRILLILLVVMSLSLIWSSIQELRKTKEQYTAALEKKDYHCVLITLLLSAAYVAMLEPIGFLISSALYIFFQTINLCPREKRNPLKFAIIAIVASTAVYSFFRYGLFLMLPGGLLTGIF